MADFVMGQGARYPILTATLTEDGNALNLASAVSVEFRGRRPNGTTVFSGACTVTSAIDGEVSYAWGANDTAVPGIYIIEFVITWVAADAGPPAVAAYTQSIPSNRAASLLVRESAT